MGDVDYHVHHIRRYDEESTASTAGGCLLAAVVVGVVVALVVGAAWVAFEVWNRATWQTVDPTRAERVALVQDLAVEMLPVSNAYEVETAVMICENSVNEGPGWEAAELKRSVRDVGDSHGDYWLTYRIARAAHRNLCPEEWQAFRKAWRG